MLNEYFKSKTYSKEIISCQCFGQKKIYLITIKLKEGMVSETPRNTGITTRLTCYSYPHQTWGVCQISLTLSLHHDRWCHLVIYSHPLVIFFYDLEYWSALNGSNTLSLYKSSYQFYLKTTLGKGPKI